MSDPILVQYTLLDSAGKAESVEFFAPSGTSPTDIQTEATAFAPLLDSVTGAKIESASFRYPLTIPGGVKANATADYLNSRGALLAFDVSGTKYRWSARIPAILSDFQDGNDVVFDPSDALDDVIQRLLGTAVHGYRNRYDLSLLGFIGASLSLHKKPR